VACGDGDGLRGSRALESPPAGDEHATMQDHDRNDHLRSLLRGLGVGLGVGCATAA